jgi:hypothetical protein
MADFVFTPLGASAVTLPASGSRRRRQAHIESIYKRAV